MSLTQPYSHLYYNMKVKNFIPLIQQVREKESLDLDAWEDLSIGLMNLISLEEHAFFSYVKTQDEKFLSILDNVREIRKRLLKKIVKDNDGSEKWCMSKHLLASSMRFFEVGNRLLHDGDKSEADKMYKDAAEMYGLFWKINYAEPNEKVAKDNLEDKKGLFNSIKKLLECCKE